MPKHTVIVTIKDVPGSTKIDAENFIRKLLGHAGYNVEATHAPDVSAYRQVAETKAPAPAAPPAKPAEAPKA